ncbi:MAG: hypothetical protein Q4F00_05545, partial [bacterium]|nr:hypothetical protein [bacterium]
TLCKNILQFYAKRACKKQVTSPEDMKKDAIRDVNKLFNALAKITCDSVTSNNDPLDKLLVCSVKKIDEEGKSKSGWSFNDEGHNYRDVRANNLFWAIHEDNFRRKVCFIKQNETNLPISQISNRAVTERICNDIRYTITQLQLNDNNWRFSSFSGNSIYLEHDLPSRAFVISKILAADYGHVGYTIDQEEAHFALSANKDLSDKILVYDRIRLMHEGEHVCIAGDYVKELGCWSFSLLSFLETYTVASKNKDTFYFSDIPSIVFDNVTIKYQLLYLR